MQRTGLITAVFSILTLATVPACNGKDDGAKATTGQKGDAKATGDANTDAKAAGEAGKDSGPAPSSEAGEPAEAGDAEAGATAEAGEVAAEAGAEEAGAEAGAEEAGGTETGGEDVVPGLLELVKSLDNDDAAANKALTDALAAGGAKLDAAKAANDRGEQLMTKGESERAEAFFTWAQDTHSKYANPVYNLAKLAAYAGDLEIAKEHLAELKKRGNKKLMKKVGVEPAFAPLHDDPEVRKIYEQ